MPAHRQEKSYQVETPVGQRKTQCRIQLTAGQHDLSQLNLVRSQQWFDRLGIQVSITLLAGATGKPITGSLF